MFRLKGCQKCAGDLALDQDIYGEEWRCLQCGRRFVVASQPTAPRQRIGAQLALFPLFAPPVAVAATAAAPSPRYGPRRCWGKERSAY